MHDIRSLIRRCETMNIASLNASELNEASLMRLWKSLCQFVAVQLSAGRDCNVQGFGKFQKNPQGQATFAFQESYSRKFGLRATKPVTVDARSSNISYAGLAMQAGINKDAARVGLSEIFQKFGHYAGTLGDSARLQFAGVGTLVCNQRSAHFNANARSMGLSMTKSSPALRAPLSIPSNAFPTNKQRGPAVQSLSPLASSGKHFLSRPEVRSARSVRSYRPQQQQQHNGAGGGQSTRGMQLSKSMGSKMWGASQQAIQNAGVDPKLLSSYNRRPLGQAKPVSQREAMEYNRRMAAEKRAAAEREKQLHVENDMLRLQQLEQDLREDIEERQRLTSSNRRLGQEQKRAASRRRRKERKEHRREHKEMPDTTWKFTDNAQVANEQAAARAAQKRQLDAQRQAQREFAATLSLSARHQSTKLGMTGNRAPPKQHPVFFPGPKEIIRGKIVPPQAAEAAYREAYQRHERDMQRKLELARRKEAEVAREAERQDMEYMRRKEERRRAQHQMNTTLASQVRKKKRHEEKRVTKLLTESAPDHSHVHPEEAARNYLVEEQAKAALRAALDEQVEQRKRMRKKERRQQIRQDRFFIKGVNQAMEEDRLHRARQRQGLIDSLQYEWQRQKDLKALMSETEKKLR